MIKRNLSNIITISCCILCCIVTALVSADSIVLQSEVSRVDISADNAEIITMKDKLNLAFSISELEMEIEVILGTPPSHITPNFNAVKAARALVNRLVSDQEEVSPFVSSDPLPTPSPAPDKKRDHTSSVSASVQAALFDISYAECQLYHCYSQEQGKGQIYIYQINFYGRINSNQCQITVYLDAQSLIPYSVTVSDSGCYFSSNDMLSSQIEILGSYWNGSPAYDQKSRELLETYYSLNGYIPHIDIAFIGSFNRIASYSFDVDTKYYVVKVSNKNESQYTMYVMTDEVLSKYINQTDAN